MNHARLQTMIISPASNWYTISSSSLHFHCSSGSYRQPAQVKEVLFFDRTCFAVWTLQAEAAHENAQTFSPTNFLVTVGSES
jgi:hypothetical protein